MFKQTMSIHRNPTRAVRIGNITVGDNHPIAVQSMTATKTQDIDATVALVHQLAAAGADVVRIAVDSKKDAAALAETRGGTLIAEFNTFASPTRSAAVDVMESTLGVRWTHWIGRYFPRLEDTDEVPPWMRDNWEREWDDTWTFEGPGFVLLYEDAHVEVLEVGVAFENELLRRRMAREQSDSES